MFSHKKTYKLDLTSLFNKEFKTTAKIQHIVFEVNIDAIVYAAIANGFDKFIIVLREAKEDELRTTCFYYIASDTSHEEDKRPALVRLNREK